MFSSLEELSELPELASEPFLFTFGGSAVVNNGCEEYFTSLNGINASCGDAGERNGLFFKMEGRLDRGKGSTAVTGVTGVGFLFSRRAFSCSCSV